MKHNKELFSICLICYNHEKYILDAIESILAQTYANIEIIICDDYSTDNSWEIIQTCVSKLKKRFNRVVAFQNSSNQGLILSLNKMILKAEGNLIYLLSGDDMLSSNYVSDVMHSCREHPESAVFVTNGYYVKEDTKYSEIDITSLTPFYCSSPDFCKDTLFERLYWHNCVFAPGVSLKRELYDKFGLYDADIFIEDWEYWLRITRTKETEFLYIDNEDVFYRTNPNSASSKAKNEVYIEKWLRFLNAREKIIDKYGAYVGEEEYIKRKRQILLDEWQFYRVNIPKDERKMLKTKLGPFIKNNWRILGWKQLIDYYRMYANALIRKQNYHFLRQKTQ